MNTLSLSTNCIPMFPDDITRIILSYVPTHKLVEFQRVNKRWKQFLTNPSQLRQIRNCIAFTDFPNVSTHTGFLRFVQLYKNNPLKKLNLEYLFSLKGSDLETLNEVKTRALVMQDSLYITSAHFQKFMQSNPILSSPQEPASFSIRAQVQTQQASWFAKVALQALQNQPHLHLNSLTLQGCNKLTAQQFIAFIKTNKLVSPYKLDLSYCRWVNGAVLETLVEANIKCHDLNISHTLLSSSELCHFIKKGGLHSPCRLIMRSTRIDTKIFDACVESNTLIRELDSRDCKLFTFEKIDALREGALFASPLSLRLPLFQNGLLDCLSKRKIVVRTLDIGLFPFSLEKAFKELAWTTQPIKLHGRGWLNNAVLEASIQSQLNIKALDMQDCTKITSDQFSACVSAHLFQPSCSLYFGNCQWLDNAALFQLAAKGVTIKFLFLEGTCPDLHEGLIKLCQTGAFDVPGSCIALPNEQQELEAVLKALALTRIQGISLPQTPYEASKLLELFKNPQHFRHLRIVLIDCTWFDAETHKSLAQWRPNLHIIND